MKRALAWVVVALAASCASPDRAPEAYARTAHAPAYSPAAGLELVAYLARLRGMNERSLVAETNRQREMAKSRPNDLAQVKIALALALQPQVDEGEILALVEPVARREVAEDDVRAMASFLQVQALERRRLKESAATASNRLRDERRATEAQKQRADALQERAALLQQKIDALTEIEKSLSDRQVQGR